MAPLPLLKCPLVVLEEIIENLTLTERFNLSVLSKQMNKRLLQLRIGKIEVQSMKITVAKPELQIRLTTAQEEIKFVIFPNKKALIQRGVADYILNYVPVQCYAIQKRNEYFFDAPGPTALKNSVVHKKVANLTKHLSRLSIVKKAEVNFQMNIGIKDFMSSVKNVENFQKVDVLGGRSMMFEEEDIPFVANSKLTTIECKVTQLESIVNTFLKQWIAGNFPHVERIDFERDSYRRMEMTKFFTDVEFTPSVRTNPLGLGIPKRTKHQNTVDIVRKTDNQRATLGYCGNGGYATFEVWTEEDFKDLVIADS
ncbi:unnamed protein product [Caenorhabditis nigoni]|nr:hypothetical protein B9Z55_023937 [Caenorhabditis nigoni]